MKKKDRIAVVLGNLGIDGVSKYATETARALVLGGHEVDMIVLGKVKSTAFLPKGVTLEVHHHRRAIFGVRESINIRRRGYRKIFINQAHYGIIFSLTTKKSCLAEMAIILHEVPTNLGRHPIKIIRHSITKMALQRFTNVIAVTSALRQKAVSYYALEADRVSTIYPSFTAQPAPMNSHREGLIFVGRLEREKQVDFLIRSFYRTSGHHDEKLYIVGSGSLLASLELLTYELGLHGRVLFLGEIYEVHAELTKRKALLLASEYESAGFVIIEALAAGCQVVSTDCDVGPRELLANGEFGHLVPQGNPGAFDDAIISALSTPANFSIGLQQHLKKFQFDTFQERVNAL